MAVTTFWYGTPVKNMYDGTSVIDWNTDTIKVALCTATYTPNQDTHAYFSDITNEITGTGYSAGGVTISTPTVTYDSATNEIRLDAADPSWAAASFTARYAIWYKSTGVAGTSPLVGYMDFGADQTVSSGTFTITLNASGAFKLTAS